MLLFDEGTINGLTLKNRIVRSATWEGMCDQCGIPTERLIDLYRDLARGGVGLIISGYTYVRIDGIQMPGKMGLDSEEQIPALRRLTEAVHHESGRIFCQLVHAGGLAAGSRPLAPSAVKANFPTPPRAMTPQDIPEIVTAFAAAAGRSTRRKRKPTMLISPVASRPRLVCRPWWSAESDRRRSPRTCWQTAGRILSPFPGPSFGSRTWFAGGRQTPRTVPPASPATAVSVLVSRKGAFAVSSLDGLLQTFLAGR